MARSIEEISKSNVRELREEAAKYVSRNSFTYIQQGLELLPGKIKSHECKSDLIEFISKCEVEPETVEPETVEPETVKPETVEPETPTHPKAKGIGLDMLTQACKSTQMKVFALGGIRVR